VPKLKTNKTAAKRFKITGTGRIMRNSTRLNHLMMSKSTSRRRRLMAGGEVTGGDAKRIKRMIPGLK
jgi:large subunit ribosomal protein L35